MLTQYLRVQAVQWGGWKGNLAGERNEDLWALGSPYVSLSGLARQCREDQSRQSVIPLPVSDERETIKLYFARNGTW